jgi:hypothetical protein
MTRGLTRMMTTLLLICALGTPPATCSTATAEAVIQGPDAMSLVESFFRAKVLKLRLARRNEADLERPRHLLMVEKSMDLAPYD